MKNKNININLFIIFKNKIFNNKTRKLKQFIRQKN